MLGISWKHEFQTLVRMRVQGKWRCSWPIQSFGNLVDEEDLTIHASCSWYFCHMIILVYMVQIYCIVSCWYQFPIIQQCNLVFQLCYNICFFFIAFKSTYIENSSLIQQTHCQSTPSLFDAIINDSLLLCQFKHLLILQITFCRIDH